LAGIRKCGSTTLFKLLSQHPQVVTGTKELNYFGYHFLNEKSFPNCLELNCTGKITVDGTVSCTSMSSSPFEIFETLPDTKLLFLLRNPSERAYSGFRMSLHTSSSLLMTKNFTEYVRDGLVVMKKLLAEYEKSQARGEKKTFMQYVLKSRNWHRYKDLGHSLYYYILKPFFDIFPRENILVLKTQELDTDPEALARKTFKFLGLQDDVQMKFSIRENQREGAAMDPAALTMLEDFFRPYNQRFNNLVQEDMELDLQPLE
jgi:hypothetical protein